MTTITFVSKTGGAWYDISFRYDPDLVTLIKDTIPSPYRKYEPSTHTWSAAESWARAFSVAARAFGHTCVNAPSIGPNDPYAAGRAQPPPPGASWGTGPTFGSRGNPFPPPGTGPFSSRFKGPPKPPPMPPPPPPSLEENWAKTLMRRCPPDLRKDLYRAMSKVLHTDLGGDQTLQQELNDARAQFEKETG